MTDIKRFKKVSQTGSMMIEAMAMLMLIAMVTPTLYKKSAERTLELQDINTATHVRTLIKAVDNYTAANYTRLLQEVPEGESAVVTIDDLSDFLPYGYRFDVIKNFEVPIATIKRQPDSDSITSFVFFPQVGEINEMRASRIASMIGSNGGYIDSGGAAKGVGGVWSLTSGEVDDQLASCDAEERHCVVSKGSIVAASSESINAVNSTTFENSKYLQRTPAVDEEWRNTMLTNLYMGGSAEELGSSQDVPYSKILGVDQMIIGGTATEAGDETDASLVVKARGAKEGAAFVEGSLRALSGALSVTGTEDNPELDFADSLLLANNDEFSVNVNKTAATPDFTITKEEGAERAGATFNVDTKVTQDNTFTAEGNTYLASAEGKKLEVGPEGNIMKAESGNVNILSGEVLITQTNNGGVTESNVDIDAVTTIHGDYTNDPMYPNLNPNFTVQGNAYVANILEAGEIDAHKFDTLELHAGGRGWDADNIDKRWLHVTADGIKAQDLNDNERMTIDVDETVLYGPDGSETSGAMFIDDEDAGLYSTEAGKVVVQRGAITATGTPGTAADNLVDVRATRMQVAGSDDNNVAFEIIAGEGEGSARTQSSVGADVDQFLVQKGDNMKLLNIVSTENDTALGGDSTVEIDPTTFNVYARTTTGDDINNQILKVDASSGLANTSGSQPSGASVYIRRGAIELEGSPSSSGSYAADEGVGYVEASRFVANNEADSTGTLVRPVYAGDYTSGGYDTGVMPDRYMVNPAYTSVMHDIKLTTRGGARLSDILPDFINKGIYIVNNTYQDGVNFNSLNVSVSGGSVVSSIDSTYEISEAQTFGNNRWASPYMGMIPSPQCPPGHARVITITPASFQMSQAGDMVLGSDGRYYVKEFARLNDLAGVENLVTDTAIPGASFQSRNIVGSGTLYYLGYTSQPSATKSGSPYAPKPLYFQQSTWLKSKVIAYGSGGRCDGDQTGASCGSNFLGWAAIMGFIYPYALYSPIITELGASSNEDDLANNTVYWNVFPVQARSLEAYATVYCYFDRTNIFSSGIDSKYVDQYDQINNFRSIYNKSNSSNADYIERLNDPQLKYSDPW